MSFSINRAIITGNCTKQPELRFTPSGTAVLNFSVATNRSVKDEQADGGYRDVATFHNITVFGKICDWLSKNLAKGQAVTVTGRIENSTYEKEGKTFYSSKIIADDVIPHRSPKTTSGAPTQHQEEQNQPDPTDSWGDPTPDDGEETPF